MWIKANVRSCSSRLIIKMVDPSNSRLSHKKSRSFSNHVWIMLPNGNGVQEDMQKYKLRGVTINTLNLYCVYENSQNYSKASMEDSWQESSQFTDMCVNLCHCHLWCQPATCLVFPPLGSALTHCQLRSRESPHPTLEVLPGDISDGLIKHKQIIT